MFGAIIAVGHSMEPAIKDGASLTCDTSKKRIKNIQRGDIVVLKVPNYKKYGIAKKRILKRVVALAGDTVCSKNGCLYINGKIEKRKRLGKTFCVSEQVIPEGHIFVLGDNREVSIDSRTLGPFPIKRVKSVVVNYNNRKRLGYTPGSTRVPLKNFKTTYKEALRIVYKLLDLEE